MGSNNHCISLPQRRARTWFRFEDLERAEKVFRDIKAALGKGRLESCQDLSFKRVASGHGSLW
ncbi:hypothetical protein BB934_42145 (plasmid) [Microvirga ossetica]|uniref:Uncharacterized protein n=1 Tax=Microvirga ossetica TaxID=1882682 RepID=A0A1B2EXN7_9HYPH|nr:hypothetical protein BB934_42145 [Microvirga ossetica]